MIQDKGFLPAARATKKCILASVVSGFPFKRNLLLHVFQKTIFFVVVRHCYEIWIDYTHSLIISIYGKSTFHNHSVLVAFFYEMPYIYFIVSHFLSPSRHSCYCDGYFYIFLSKLKPSWLYCSHRRWGPKKILLAFLRRVFAHIVHTSFACFE